MSLVYPFARLRAGSVRNLLIVQLCSLKNVISCYIAFYKKMSLVVFSPPQETRGWPQCGDDMRVIGLHNQSWFAGKPRSGLMWIAPNAIRGCNGQHRREPWRGSIIKSLFFKIFCYIKHWTNGWIINNSHWTPVGVLAWFNIIDPTHKSHFKPQKH